jgi:hypothetical protein
MPARVLKRKEKYVVAKKFLKSGCNDYVDALISKM